MQPMHRLAVMESKPDDGLKKTIYYFKMAFQKKKPEVALTVDEALIELERFCAFQDRYTQEIRQKLKTYEIDQADADQILAYLIEEKYVDDARFAEAFVRGKIRANHWGKIKISLELRSRGIDEKLVVSATENFPKGEYIQILKNLAERKQQEMAGQPAHAQKHKLISYLLRNGFEQDLVFEVVNRLLLSNLDA